MKATQYILGVLALVVTTFTACTKEDNSVVSENNEVTLVTSLAPAPGINTKTVMNETSDGTILTTWEVGDYIWVKYKNTSNEDVEAQATVTAVDGSGNATISVTMTDPKDASTITFGFPYNYWHNDTDLKANQIGTLENIKDNYAASSGTGTLTVSGGDATLPTGVTMTPSICIWKFSLKDGATDITSSVTTLSVFLGSDSGSEKYVVKPSSLEYIYVALNGSATPKYVSIAALTATKAYMKEKSGVTLASGKLYRTEGLAMDEVHVFSVSDTKRVIIAPGNLQASYDGSNWTWNFATHQYDIIGVNSGNIAVNGKGTLSTSSGTVDLFGFSTSAPSYGIDMGSGDYSGSFVDWGNNNIGGRGKNYWKTLSDPEWKYLTGKDEINHENYRKRGGQIVINTGGSTLAILNVLCTKATVNEIKGFIIFPDRYAGGTPSGVTWNTNTISNGNYANSGAKGWGATVTSAGWTNLENAGCVFLPVGGFRYSNYLYFIEGGYGYTDDPTGYYASSSIYDDDENYCLRFSNDGFDPHNRTFKRYGISVRLVHELN
ncbi:MAG: hypothetical protein J5604_04595 [Bacteroidales bacterium]|nr:hypothetical protein [Bacteroidales bacterium]